MISNDSHKLILFFVTILLALYFLLKITVLPITGINWPTTEGTIVLSEVVVTDWTPPDNFPSWYPNVLYRYSVDGQTYESERIEVISAANGNTDRFAQRTVERYPVGAQVTVYYSPKNPAVSLLEPGLPNNDPLLFTMFLLISGFLVGGIFISCWILLKFLRHEEITFIHAFRKLQ